MESKLLEAPIPGIPSHNTFKSSRSALHFVSRKKLNFVQPNLGRNGLLPRQVSCSSASISPIPIRYARKKRVDESENLTLDSIRHSLLRQEDSIIFSLLERAQYSYNANTYDHDAFSVDGFHGSLVEFMVRETEKLQAQVGRYKSPNEHPFFPADLPEPMLPPLQYPQARNTFPLCVHI
ncbi:Chorismate mutase 3, chloroplastic [Morella rubra]|uniref:chorismate mutase n=1 Tax=Morella rubra TaxID=262757 RepID=A0A6A1V8A8_9ROSI|nr:Chorismate mutase 3, chloroplastic [Morella rubra]